MLRGLGHVGNTASKNSRSCVANAHTRHRTARSLGDPGSACGTRRNGACSPRVHALPRAPGQHEARGKLTKLARHQWMPPRSEQVDLRSREASSGSRPSMTHSAASWCTAWNEAVCMLIRRSMVLLGHGPQASAIEGPRAAHMVCTAPVNGRRYTCAATDHQR